MKLHWYCLSLLIILINNSLSAQTTSIKGKITDASTGEPIPFANISLKKIPQGTISDLNGIYEFETDKPTDSIVFSSIGYKSKTVAIKRKVAQTVNVELKPESQELEAIVVRPGENPAHRILRNIIANKSRNSTKKVSAYQCEIYNKMQVDISNISNRLKNRKIMKQFDFVFENVDSSELTGKKYIPVLLSETLSDYYYQKDPKTEKEVIKASKISGTSNASIAQFTGKLYQEFDVYDNYLTVFEDGFVSPLSDVGLLFYRYYITDSATIGNNWCYKIQYKPKRKQERTFTGSFWVADSTWAIKEIDLRMAKDANINFINDFYAINTFEKANDTLWYLAKEQIFADFNLSEKITGLYGRKTSVYSKFQFEKPISKEIIKLPTEVTVADTATEQSDKYWDKSRPINLTSKEQKVYTIVDSVKNMPIYKTVYDWINLIINYYYPVGPYFEYGPYFSTYSFNKLEGNRVRIGGRTSNNFSKKIMFDGYAAYGFDDKKIKYGGGFIYMLNKNPRNAFGASYINDVRQLGQSPNAFISDNILSSILRRNPNDKLTYIKGFKSYYEKEWIPGFSNTILYEYKQIKPTRFIQFQNLADNTTFKEIVASELTLNTRFAYKESYLLGEFERVSVGTPYPVCNLALTWGMKNTFNSQYSYFRPTLTFTQKVHTNPFGYLRYTLEASKIIGTVPYPLLELHKGNETYAFDYNAFNMMNYYEFASDQYVSLFLEQHLQGILLNHIPLLRRLKLREVASVKGLIGSLSDKNKNVMNIRNVVNNNVIINDVRDPYFEASVGVENILKILRIDAMWRLNYLDKTRHPNIQQFGVRAMLQVSF